MIDACSRLIRYLESKDHILADAIDIGCTPRHEDGRSTAYLSRTGYIDVYCKIPLTNITSNMLRINVYGGIR